MEIGVKIKKIRELKNLTQEYMAQELNMSQPTYSRIEKDEKDVTMGELNKVAEVLGMRTEDLISFDEKYVLNNYGEIKGNQIGLNNFPSELKSLYEDKIKLLEDKITYLQEIITNFKSNNI